MYELKFEWHEQGLVGRTFFYLPLNKTPIIVGYPSYFVRSLGILGDLLSTKIPRETLQELTVLPQNTPRGQQPGLNLELLDPEPSISTGGYLFPKSVHEYDY